MQTYREIIADIRNKRFSPIYLLMGEEPYYLDKISEWLEKSVVEEEDKDFNFEVFYGAETSVEAVATAARQYPMMASHRFVILKEAQALSQYASNLGKLDAYVANAPETTVLCIVIKGKPLPATSKLVKAVKKAGGVIFVSDKIKEYQMATPIREYCQEKRISIDPDALDLLVEYLGNSLNKVFGEIDKLIVGGGKALSRITRREVLDNIGLNKEFNAYELVRALSTKNYPKAMTIVNYFAANPRQNPINIVVGPLFKFFSQLAMAWFSPDRSEKALMTMFGMNAAWMLKDIRAGMQSYNASQAVNAISVIRELDCKSKGIDSMQNEHELLKEAVFKIFTTK